MVLLMLVNAGVVVADTAPEGYKLVFADEFTVDGPPNPENWGYEHGFVRNKELQWYQPDNAYCDGGHLIIEARKVDIPNLGYDPGSKNWGKQRERISYTSSCVITRGRHAWRYGRFEIRAKIQAEDGLWPAIWLLGADEGDGRNWPACGEIDVMEYYRGNILANAAWAGKDGAVTWDDTSIPVEALADGSPEAWAARFHIWRMDWDEEQIRIYLDDRLLNTVDLSKTVNQTEDGINPFHRPHYLLLNLAIGGTAGGDPSQTQFPRQFIVDYVRVYQPTND